jgi:hypothetical protein
MLFTYYLEWKTNCLSYPQGHGVPCPLTEHGNSFNAPSNNRREIFLSC